MHSQWKRIGMPGICALILGCAIVSFDAAARQAPYEPPLGEWTRLNQGQPILSPGGSGFEARIARIADRSSDGMPLGCLISGLLIFPSRSILKLM